MRSSLGKLAIVAVAIALGAGCGGTDGEPLGGPHGGTTSSPPPTSGPAAAAATGSQAATETTGGSSSGEPASAGGAASAGGNGSGGTGNAGSQGSGGSGGGQGASNSTGGSGTQGGSNASSGSSGGSAPTPPAQAAAPTWTDLFTTYLAEGTSGDCGNCHSEMGSASGAYSYLNKKGYISGASSRLVNPSDSILSWFGGNMPPGGGTDASAVSDFNAWAAAGAANN